MANNVNRTNKNTPNNRGKLTEKEKFLLLRSVWQGWRDLNPRHQVLETCALAS